MQLFVERKVINFDEIHDWFTRQSIDGLIKPSEYHITVAYSRKDVNLQNLEFDTSTLLIPGNQFNGLEIFGDYLVQLVLTDVRLFSRFNYFKQNGCSWDYPSYCPHISIAEHTKTDLNEIEPYQGNIIPGPEIWEELNTDFSYERDDDENRSIIR